MIRLGDYVAVSWHRGYVVGRDESGRWIVDIGLCYLNAWESDIVVLTDANASADAMCKDDIYG